MAENSLTFTPDEFKIIETGIEFDESYHREESIGFYTLQEQLEDGFSKLLPSSGSISRYQISKTREIVDNLRDLYNEFIIPVEDGYKVQSPEFKRKIPWLLPVYTPDTILQGAPQPFSIPTQARLYENPNAPGFYTNSLLRNLPHPFAIATEGRPYVFNEPTEFVNESGKDRIRALPEFTVTKTMMRENGIPETVLQSQKDTDDKIVFKGYFLKKRELDVPNPYEGHPFFQSNEDTFVPVGGMETKTEIFPEIQTILEHGVPVTNDPYVEGTKYLKLYDVKLSEIPWTVWKTKFPPAPPLQTTPPVEALPFTTPSRDVPSKVILDMYRVPYYPGVSARHWLLNQLDGGEFVIKALLSQAGEQGTVGQIPGAEATPPAGKYEDCDLTNKSFYDFITTGVLRRKWTSANGKPEYVCVPTELILQERKRHGYNHTQWTEGMSQTILKDYIQSLEQYRPLEDFGKPPEYKPAPPISESILHTEVTAILQDSKRHEQDKLKDVTTLIKDTTVTKNRYLDSEGQFVVCEHSLAILRGALQDNKDLFIRTWTDTVTGYQVCKFCGEQILQADYVEQDDFDANNNVVKRGEVVEKATKHLEYQKDIQSLMIQLGYEESNTSHSMLKTLITLFQVTPDSTYFTPLFQIIPEIRKTLVDKTGTVNNIRGAALGIAIFILLLQSHVPTLYPRRSIGTASLPLTGYPRDKETDEKGGILDGVLQSLQQTYMTNPEGFSGPYEEVLVKVIDSYSEIRKFIVAVIKKCLERKDVQTMLELARTKVVPVETTKIRVQQSVATPRQSTPACSTLTPILMFETYPDVRQKEIPLEKLSQASTATIVQPSQSRRQEVADIPPAVTLAQQKLKTDIPKKFEAPVSENYHANFALASFLADTFQISSINVRSVNLTAKPKDLLDISKGFLYELYATIFKNKEMVIKLEDMVKSNITYRLLTGDYQSSVNTVNTLRAKQRIDFVSRMRQKTDEERDTIRRLLQIGQAPIIITKQDKELYAQEEESFEVTLTTEEEDEDQIKALQGDSEDGQQHGQDEEGFYGTMEAKPNVDGHDYQQPDITDDANDGI